jgi:hypothetical protein
MTGLADDNCVSLTENEVKEVQVTLAATADVQGRLAGGLPVSLYSVDGGQPHTMSVPIVASLYRPVNTGVRNILVTGAVAFALALAWAIATFGKHATHRFQSGRDLRVATMPVTVTASGLQRLTPAGADATGFFGGSDFTSEQAPKPSGNLDRNGLKFRRSGQWVWPYSKMRPEVTSSAGSVIAISADDAAAISTAEGNRRTPANFAYGTQFYLTPSSAPARNGGVAAQLTAYAEGTNGDIIAPVARLNNAIVNTDWAQVADALSHASTAEALTVADSDTTTEAYSTTETDVATPTRGFKLPKLRGSASKTKQPEPEPVLDPWCQPLPAESEPPDNGPSQSHAPAQPSVNLDDINYF